MTQMDLYVMICMDDCVIKPRYDFILEDGVDMDNMVLAMEWAGSRFRELVSLSDSSCSNTGSK